MEKYKLILLFLCSVVIISIVVWKYLKLELVQVTGNSMYPTYRDGRPVLIRKRLNPYKDLVFMKVYVYTCPDGYSVIKRLIHTHFMKGELYAWFEGDNADDSKDSRCYGYVPVNMIEGVLVFHKDIKSK